MPDHSVTLTVERLGGLGDGMAVWEATPVILPKTLPGDVVQATLCAHAGGHFLGTQITLLTPSPARSAPPCPHFSACGGCALQHLPENDYRAFKTGTLAHALRKAGFPGAPAEMHFLPTASRRRAEFKLLREGHATHLAYAQPRSHALTPIAQCLILRPRLQAALPAIAACLENSTATALQLTEADDGALDITLTGGQEVEAPALLGVPGAARISLDGRIWREVRPVTVRCGDVAVELPPGAFLQASPEAQALLTGTVCEALAGCATVLDLFSGIGTYGFPLVRNARVTAAEGDGGMMHAMRRAATAYSSSLNAMQRDLFRYPFSADECSRHDGIAINPPREGAKAQSLAIADSSVRRVVMISCNPATFARDARILQAGGFSLTRALGVDQFVWSAHLEIAAVFERPG